MSFLTDSVLCLTTTTLIGEGDVRLSTKAIHTTHTHGKWIL